MASSKSNCIFFFKFYIITSFLLLYLFVKSHKSECDNPTYKDFFDSHCLVNRSCMWPGCYCNPNNYSCLEVKDIPQFVIISYNGAMTDTVYSEFRHLFYRRRNPDNRSTTGTFFLNHGANANYKNVQKLYASGHEIGSYGISGNQKVEDGKWKEEMFGQCEKLNKFANISMEDCRGLRAPIRAIGGEEQFIMMKNNNFTYDHSCNILLSEGTPIPWPYPLDLNDKHDYTCQVGARPCKNYEDLWIVPLFNYPSSGCTSMVECFKDKNEDDTFKILNKHFFHHYKSNKAPFPIWIDAEIFGSEYASQKTGLIRLVSKLEKMNDVYLISISDLIFWLKNPIGKNELRLGLHGQYPWDHTRPSRHASLS